MNNATHPYNSNYAHSPLTARIPHHSRSARYSVINSTDIIERMKAHGLELTSIQKTRVRDNSREGYQKHLMRFKPTFTVPAIAGHDHEVLVVNSHDGSSSYRMLAGLIRFACSNGIIVGDFSTEVKIRHVGMTDGKLAQGLKEVYATFETQKRVVEQMQSFTPTPLQIAHVATEIARERIAKRKGSFDHKLTLSTVMGAKRDADAGLDLWTMFNRIQESVIRGGIAYKYKTIERDEKTGSEKTKRHNRHTKEVKGIDQQQELNRMVFNKCFALLALNNALSV